MIKFNSQGITIIEILVAASLVGVVSIATHSLLISSLFTNRQVQTDFRLISGANSIFVFLRNDIHGASSVDLNQNQIVLEFREADQIIYHYDPDEKQLFRNDVAILADNILLEEFNLSNRSTLADLPLVEVEMLLVSDNNTDQNLSISNNISMRSH